MAANRNRRLAKEIQDVQKDTHSGVTLEPVDSDSFDKLDHFYGVFKGPPDTPFEGGIFRVDIRIPNEYPFQPPKMKFLTKIWHPNISSVTGAICLDTLGTAWSPILTLKSALISLQSLLSSPEPKDPQDAEVARMLITDPEAFVKKAQEWAVQYAGAPAEKSIGSESTSKSTQDQEQRRKKAEEVEKKAQYRGYNAAVVDKFIAMGFDVPTVVSAFEFVGLDHDEDDLDEDTVSDVTARLFGES
ncbi:ubiquitin-conjugating enzyme E2-16 kDa [Sphaceloma murrayae]|uniref:Ubiquitin-conjugating enzyme E2 1 n=1 Tax=Sphaceloma murrayae TaxID=2082308 RepID=A0A2K1QK01_9PEZI|nr:ubiquitin-conjugating enzyme E2-16 kDa [Sphaceloma murrayae]